MHSEPTNPLPLDPNTAIETERLRLVPVSHRWIPEIFAEFRGDIVRWMSPPVAKEIAETEAFVQMANEQLAAGTDLIVAFMLRTTGEFLGCGGVHSLHKQSPSLGLWVKKSAHGNGYGLEAIGGLLEWLRQNYHFDVARYDVDRANIASRRIAEHYGGVVAREFVSEVREGKVLDLVEYEIPIATRRES